MRHTVTLPCTIKAFSQIRALIDSTGEELDLSDAAIFGLRLCSEELFSNIVLHGGGEGSTVEITFCLAVGETHIRIRFEDTGPKFNPLDWPSPPQYESIETAQVGGLGVEIVRTYAESFDYDWNGRNVVSFAIRRDLEML